MYCPDDGTLLGGPSAEVQACRTCRGRLVSVRAFEDLQPAVHALLRPEEDRASGAFARVRVCPGCARAMRPLRLAAMPAWLDWCEPCQRLWVERLDEPVIEGLRARLARARGAAALAPEARQEAAVGIAEEVATHQRELADLRLVRLVLEFLR
ncbi:MAG: hypothetical protein NDI82_00785 [Anaeromyxobacteraceae bacterium]|nr:hypothetical protein [Anaeromyxobacteraceae bacterium]